MRADPPPVVHPRALVETDRIGAGTRIWAFAHVMPKVTIGCNCNIGDHVFIESGVTIGDNVTIKNHICVWEHVHIADNVFLGPHVVFTNDRYPRRRETPYTPVDTWVEEGVTIGANATIVGGVRLGSRCFVGAAAVVTEDVEPHALVIGTPARRHSWVCHCGQPFSAHALGPVICPGCARIFEIDASSCRRRQ